MHHCKYTCEFNVCCRIATKIIKICKLHTKIVFATYMSKMKIYPMPLLSKLGINFANIGQIKFYQCYEENVRSVLLNETDCDKKLLLNVYNELCDEMRAFPMNLSRDMCLAANVFSANFTLLIYNKHEKKFNFIVNKCLPALLPANGCMY